MNVQYDQREGSLDRNRKSQGFVFNEDVEKHIGKHTGKYYARIRQKTHFDGFTRFSEYLTHSEKDENSLAKDNDSFADVSHQHSFPQAPRQSQKIAPQEIKNVLKPQSNPCSKSTDALKPVFGEFSISSIKTKKNSIGPSEIKNIRQILRAMDESKDFENQQSFCITLNNRPEPNEINKKAIQTEVSKRGEVGVLNQEKEEKQSHPGNQFNKQNKITKEKENRKSLLRKSPQKILAEDQNKQRRKSRVSFTQTVVIGEFDKESPKHSQQAFKEQKEEGRDQSQIEEPQMLLSEIRMSRQFLRQQKPQADSRALLQKKIVKIKEQETDVTEEQTQNMYENKQIPFSDHYYEPQQYENYESEDKFEDKKQEVREVKPNKRQMKKRKEKRITDSQPSAEGPKEDAPSVKLQKRKYNKTSKSNQPQRKLFENQSNKLHDHEHDQIDEPQIEKGRYVSENQRYPKRTRIKPVSFWQNEKVHYRAGIAIGIDRATLNLRDLLQTSHTSFQHVFNLNLHNNEIEMEMVLPGKREFWSKGIKEPYQTLLISMSQKSKHIEYQRINFDDGIRCEPIEGDKIIEVPQGRQFELHNECVEPIFLHMKLI